MSSLSSVETVPTAPVALLDRSIYHRVSGSQAAVMRCVSEPAVGLRRGRDGGFSLFLFMLLIVVIRWPERED